MPATPNMGLHNQVINSRKILLRLALKLLELNQEKIRLFYVSFPMLKTTV